MNSHTMLKTKCKPGYWHVNVAPLGEDPFWEEQPMPVNQDEKLFGYDVKEFLAKQYKQVIPQSLLNPLSGFPVLPNLTNGVIMQTLEKIIFMATYAAILLVYPVGYIVRNWG